MAELPLEELQLLQPEAIDFVIEKGEILRLVFTPRIQVVRHFFSKTSRGAILRYGTRRRQEDDDDKVRAEEEHCQREGLIYFVSRTWRDEKGKRLGPKGARGPAAGCPLTRAETEHVRSQPVLTSNSSVGSVCHYPWVVSGITEPGAGQITTIRRAVRPPSLQRQARRSTQTLLDMICYQCGLLATIQQVEVDVDEFVSVTLPSSSHRES